MTPIGAIDPVLASRPALTTLGGQPAPSAPPSASFADLLAAGLKQVDAKVASADDLIRRFTLGEGVPVHQVTYALEEAKLSVELAMQVRARLLDGYRELMNMQL